MAAAQNAYYEDALKSDAEMDSATRRLILSQQTSLKKSHDIIKRYRDMQPA